MLNFDINISSNIQNHTWSNIQNHVDRNYRSSSNKNINPKYTKYNLMANRHDLKNDIHNHFAKLVKYHDMKLSKAHADRKYGSVKNYLERRKGVPENSIVLKIGTMDDKKRLAHAVYTRFPMTKQDAVNRVKKLDDKAFQLYCIDYRKRHPYGHTAMPMGNAVTNEDELGSDHMHYNIADLGFTPKGLASMSFSRAVIQETGKKNRLSALKAWHAQEDPAMLECMNRAYHSLGIHFNLKRTGHAYHLGQAVYEDAKRTENKQFQALGLAVQSLLKHDSVLEKQNDKLKNSQADQSAMKNTISRQKAKIHALQKFISGELTSLGQNNQIMKKQCSSLNQKLNGNQKKLKNNQSELEDLEASYQALKQEFIELQKKYAKSPAE